jgi:alpha/beta superfamily hydrolase
MITIKFSSLGSILQGYFFPSATNAAIATVIFLQGFPGVEGDELICEQLAQAGVNVFTFNYRGIFGSQGYFSFSNAIDDIGAALDFLIRSEDLTPYLIDPENIILGGWSFGSAMVPTGAVQNPGFNKIFMISGRNFGKEARKIAEDPEYAQQVTRNLDGLRTPNGPVRFQDDVISELIEMQGNLNYENLVLSLKDRHILLINGWDDDLVPIEEHTIPFYRSLVENGAKKVRIEAVRDDHEFSKTKDQMVKIILNWISGSCTTRNDQLERFL